MVVSHFFTVFRATLNLKNTREDRKRLARYRRYGKIFCFTGALIHATIVTMEFLKFPTTTNVLITNPSTAELPSISLCFFYKLRELKLIPTENGLDRSTLTLKEMNEKLLKWENFVLKCEVLDEEYKPRNCSDISPQVTEYLSIYSKCYTLFESLDPPINYRRTSIGSHFMATIVLEVKNIFTNKIGIFVNHRASLVQESLGQPSFLIFDSFYSNRAGVTFDRVKIKRLAPPYDSRCRDYRKEKCADRQTCITKCINERSYRQNKTWSARRYVEVKVGYYDGRFTSDDDRKIVENCFKRYSSSPCTEYLYNALATNEYMSPFDTNDTFRIDLAYPTGKDTVVEYIALQSWIDFICFVASIANMWTEMSMIRITRWTLEYFSKWAPEIRWPEPKEDGHGKRNKRLYDRNNNLGAKDKSYRSLWSLSDSQRQSIMKNRKISSNVSGNQYIS